MEIFWPIVPGADISDHFVSLEMSIRYWTMGSENDSGSQRVGRDDLIPNLSLFLIPPSAQNLVVLEG